MPVDASPYREAPARCLRPYSWSIYRGGCRLAPNHVGACKPKSGKR